MLKIKTLERQDLDTVVAIHADAFSRQKNSQQWLACTLNAFPRSLSYVIEQDGEIKGYILWAQKSGFRPEVVLELEQIAIQSGSQNRGLGQSLITQSLAKVKRQLAAMGSTHKHIIVSTRADNHAQALYRKTLGAEVEAAIEGLFSGDEVYMVARDV